ncbi:lipopolysaccharide biosynthesis protein [Deinococcus peraridilitoris]|nr:lipopolysaccharide biosynthesis protein [Deinococcus peraridilitoris]
MKQPTLPSSASDAGRAFLWNMAGFATRSGSGFAINIMLARLLGPASYGVIAIASLVISLGLLIADSGLSASLVQRKEIHDNDVRTAFTAQTLIGIGLALSIALSAPLLAHAYSQPILAPVLQVLAFTLVLQSASQTSAALLRRRMDFRRIQKTQVGSYLLSYLGFGIPAAYLGLGVWSLTGAQVLQTTLNLALLYHATRHPIAPLLQRDTHMLHFGGRILATNIVNWVSTYLDSFLLGRAFGTATLGLYNRAFFLLNTPVTVVVSASQGVLFAATSRTQNQTDTARQTYLATFGGLATVIVPAFMTAAAAAASLVEATYGQQWVNAIPFVLPLAIAMPLFALMAIAGPILAGLNRPQEELRAQSLAALVAIPALLLAASWSLAALVWVGVFVHALRFTLMTAAACNVLRVSAGTISRILLRAVLLAGLCAFLPALIEQFWTAPALLKFLLEILVSGTTWLLLLLMLPNVFTEPETKRYLHRLTRKLPQRFARRFA